MKKIILVIVVLLTSINTLTAQDWKTNYDEAITLASKENKNIILVFSGSDWCIPCKKLDKDILQSEEFKNYAAENWVLLKADFPKRKKNKLSEEQQAHNDMLAEKYKGRFPLIVMLNANGKAIGRIGYKKYSPIEYIEFLKNLE